MQCLTVRLTRRHAFQDKEPPPAFKSHSAVHMPNTVGKGPAIFVNPTPQNYPLHLPSKSAGKGGTAQENGNPGRPLIWLVPEAHQEDHAWENSGFGSAQEEANGRYTCETRRPAEPGAQSAETHNEKGEPPETDQP